MERMRKGEGDERLRYILEAPGTSEALGKMEGGLSNFFSNMAGKLINWSTKTLVAALLSAALFPILGPVGAATVAVGGSALTTKMQEELRSLSLYLREDTLNKLVEPLQGKQFAEDGLRKVIWEALSDRQANEDLKQYFIYLFPTIEKVARSTTINISEPVQSLIEVTTTPIHRTFQSVTRENGAKVARG